jgi:hypothetical protein
MYGSKCNCCGECDTRFLTLDHVQNDGFEQRKEMSQRQIISDAINSFNPSKYQILCYNCNCAKNANGGICPHKDKTLEEHLAYEKSITASHRQDKKNKTIQELLSKLNPEDLAKAISSLSVS